MLLDPVSLHAKQLIVIHEDKPVHPYAISYYVLIPSLSPHILYRNCSHSMYYKIMGRFFVFLLEGIRPRAPPSSRTIFIHSPPSFRIFITPTAPSTPQTLATPSLSLANHYSLNSMLRPSASLWPLRQPTSLPWHSRHPPV